MRTSSRTQVAAPPIARLLIFVSTICGTWCAAAQEAKGQFSGYEFFGGYLAAGQSGYNDLFFGRQASLQTGFGSTHGIETSVLRNFNRFLGFKADFSLQPHRAGFLAKVCTQSPCSPVIQSATINPKIFDFLAGPEVKLRNRSRFTPYAHGLIGVALATASLSSSGPAAKLALRTTETGFAAAVGGGADIRLLRRLSFRTGLDFNPAWVGRDDSGARSVISNARIWGGILFH